MKKYSLSKLIQLCLVILLFFGPSLAFTQTLREAVVQTVQTNPDILINIKNWLASESGIKLARAGYFPTIDLIAEYGREKSKNQANDFDTMEMTWDGVGVTLRQMLFDGFLTNNEVERNRNRTIADVYQTQGIADDVALLTVKAYLDVLRTQRVVALSKQNYNSHKKIYAMIKRRAETGIGREADKSQAYGRLALSKANLIAAKGSYRDARTVYHKIVGQKPEDLVIPKEPKAIDLPSNRKMAIQAALENHPTLRAANADIKEAMSQHKASKSTNYPRLDAVLSASNHHDIDGVKGDTEDYIAMLQLRYNLFRGGADVAKQEEAVRFIDKAKEIRNRTYTQVVESMNLSWNALKTSQAQRIYFIQHRNASRMTASSYRKQFTVGKRTLLDLLDSENELFSSETEYVNSKFNVLYSKFRVLNSEGKILPYMNVALPVPEEKLDLVAISWTPKAGQPVPSVVKKHHRAKKKCSAKKHHMKKEFFEFNKPQVKREAPKVSKVKVSEEFKKASYALNNQTAEKEMVVVVPEPQEVAPVILSEEKTVENVETQKEKCDPVKAKPATTEAKKTSGDGHIRNNWSEAFALWNRLKEPKTWSDLFSRHHEN